MSEDFIVDPGSATSNRRTLLVALIAGLVVIAAAGLLLSRLLQDDPGPAVNADGTVQLERIDLAMPLETGNGGQVIVHLLLDPTSTGENKVDVRLESDNLAEDLEPAAAQTLTLSSLNAAETATTDVAWEESGIIFPAAGWWEVDVPVQWADGGSATARFFILAPDPNVFGIEALPVAATVQEAALLYDRGLAAMTGLSSVRYTQLQGDGQGLAASSLHAVDLTDPATPSYLFLVPGGTQAIGIGEESWIQTGEGPWELRYGVGWVQPSQWGLEYRGADSFTSGPAEVINGEETRLISFRTPELETQSAAWYLWWVGVDSGMVHREVMVSRGHYMLNEFSDFDQPLGIEAPEEYVTPVPQS